MGIGRWGWNPLDSGGSWQKPVLYHLAIGSLMKIGNGSFGNNLANWEMANEN